MFFYFKNFLTSESEDFLHPSVTSSLCVTGRVQHVLQNPLHFKTISNRCYHKWRNPFIQDYLWKTTLIIQFSSVAQSCLTLCNPMNRNTSGLPVHHQLPQVTQTHVHWVGDAIQPSHLLSSPSSSALNFSQHQGLFQWVSSSHHVAKVLEFQLQHQSFQWTPRTDLF